MRKCPEHKNYRIIILQEGVIILEGLITLNKNEQRRNDIIVRYINKEISIHDVCKLLNITDRQVRRIKSDYLNNGVSSIPHRNKHLKPHNKVDCNLTNKIINLYNSDYLGWNFHHFNDILKSEYDIFVSHSFIYNTFTKEGIISPKCKRRRKSIHPPRQRKETFGELLQIDASIHKWFGNSTSALHAAIDDASGTVLAAYFDKEETTFGYYKMLEQILVNYGIPKCLYSDNRTTFKSNKKELSIDEELKGITINKTNFEVAIQKLGISLITTSNPMAKGRIERLWQTFQDRLINEMKRLNIQNIEQANEFLKVYIPKHNTQFALPLNNITSSFSILDSSLDLNMLLSIRQKFSVHKYSYLSCNNGYLVIMDDDKPALIDTKSKVDLVTRLDGIQVVEFKDKIYNIKPVLSIPKQLANEGIQKGYNYNPNSIPSKNHPWRNYKPIVHNKKLLNMMYSN